MLRLRNGGVFAFVLGGLGIGQAGAASPSTAPTYHKDIVPILQKSCQDCQRPGQVAPFSLLTYEQVRKRAGDIASVAEHRTMPPWPVSAKEGGPFRGARVLSEGELTTLSAWAESGAPEGNAADAPPARTWASSWALGEPDLVLKPDKAYTLEAHGDDEMRVFVIPSGLTEDKWVAAVDFQPGNPKVVHHILGAFDIRGAAKKLDEADPAPGYKSFGGFTIIPAGGLSGWAPGKTPIRYDDGIGRYLPANSDVLIQVHYHRSGKAETDATAIGLYFSKAPVDKQLRNGIVLPPRVGILRRPRLQIPAGDANHEVVGTMTVAQDAHLLAITPHMHWLGKDFVLKATKPDGSESTLIRIDDWNFNWQGAYDFVTPIPLPKGTRIDMKAHFDNSTGNPANPNSPPAVVGWGERTTDEMCIGFLQMTYDDEHLNNEPPPRFAAKPSAETLPAKP
ncbi:ascorbate-dependent monooxygenase [Singulisphaera sp. PoT]|uniref:ascorbate-dependent monooxygenase n=1 Tax=Singulisphaera sp. PoT TaxID=3411797 RepID=UPI003BF59C50